MIRATMVLADAATVSGGKLNLLGAGWNVIGPSPAPTAIGLLLEIPWDQANQRHQLRLVLNDADGEPIHAEATDGSQQPIALQAEFEVGRPPGTRPGTPLPVPIAIPLAPLPLAAGRRYVWQLYVNDETHDDWRLSFDTRPADMRLAG
jgi:hypothetical protein